MSLCDYEPLVVKAVLTYCYTADFDDDPHPTVAGEDWTEIEKRLYFCVALYAAARKFEIQGLGDATIESFRCITTSAFIVKDPMSRQGHDHLTSAGAGRITRLVSETDRYQDGHFRTLIFCKLYPNMSELSLQRDFIREVDKIRGNFWKHLARFNGAIATLDTDCPNLSCQAEQRPKRDDLEELGLLKCFDCGESFALERWFKYVDTSAAFDSEEDETTDEDSTVLLTPSTIC